MGNISLVIGEHVRFWKIKIKQLGYQIWEKNNRKNTMLDILLDN